MRLLRFWRRARRDDELGDELEAYVAQETADRMRDGLSAEDARLAALRKLGNTTRIRETVYEAGSLGWIEHLAKGEIIGIVRDTKYGSLREETPPSAFAPASQHPAPQPFTFLAIRSTASIATLRQELGRAYAQAGATSDVAVWPIVDQVRDSLLRDRLMSWLSGFFGVLAGLLSAVGLYGVMAYAAARRSNEIAIRMALGASRGDVVELMLGQASRLLAIGLVLGTVAAIAAGRTVAALLFGIGSHDAATFLAAAALLAAIGLAAAYVPTARAARISPLDGLRAE